ncbi:hypothetical protein E5288_WYG013743 [Bos mutus]|uniref:Mab-21-like nucleotidyltransferase domain-containing protein n=1 Tax=Bos mutus TaxID=72004 RepID=A0A6B0QRB2_9CETA|nr:hypothetical protein [Bos mutus]
MAPPRRKATRKASETASGVSAPCVEGGLSAEPSEPAAVPEAPRPGARRCGAAGASGSRREKPQVRARAARAEDQAEGPAAPTADAEPPAAPGHPLPRASTRSRGTASSARARRPQSGPPEGPGLGPRAPSPHLGRREEAPGAWKPRAVLEKLKLSRQEISVAAEVVNRLGDHLLRRLNSRESEFKGVDLLRTGSYYERVKISAPNEFDLMFTLEVPRIQLEEYCNSSAHYFVKFKRNPKGSPLDQFLEGGILSASKMLFKFRKIIKEEIKHIEDTDVIMERKKRGSPAVTLLIRKPREISVDIILALESKSSWPASTQKGLPISNWLGTKVKDNLKRQPFYLVPKHAKEGSLFQEETWRLSFSHIEKAILTNHGQTKTCCETEGVKCCRIKTSAMNGEEGRRKYVFETFKHSTLHILALHELEEFSSLFLLFHCFDNIEKVFNSLKTAIEEYQFVSFVIEKKLLISQVSSYCHHESSTSIYYLKFLQENLRNILHSNGPGSSEPFKDICLSEPQAIYAVFRFWHKLFLEKLCKILLFLNNFDQTKYSDSVPTKILKLGLYKGVKYLLKIYFSKFIIYIQLELVLRGWFGGNVCSGVRYRPRVVLWEETLHDSEMETRVILVSERAVQVVLRCHLQNEAFLAKMGRHCCCKCDTSAKREMLSSSIGTNKLTKINQAGNWKDKPTPTKGQVFLIRQGQRKTQHPCGPQML